MIIMQWTADEDKYLKEMCDACLHISQMVLVLRSRTKEGIRKRMREKGWTNLQFPVIDEKKFKEMINGSRRL